MHYSVIQSRVVFDRNGVSWKTDGNLYKHCKEWVPMQKILPAFALTMSIIAFLFGGLLNSKWAKEVNVPRVSVLINSISHGARSVADRPIEVPGELVSATSNSQFFPTLEPEMSRQSLEEIILASSASGARDAVNEMEMALAELNDPSISAEAVEELWSGVPTNAKSTLLALRTQRKIKQKLRESQSNLNETVISTMVEKLLEEDVSADTSDGSDLMNMPEVRAALNEVLRETAKLETEPDRQLLLDIINSELPFVRALADDFEKFSDQIQTLIEAADGAARNSPVFWEFSVTFFNGGGSPASISPASVLAVRSLSSRNTVLFLAPVESSSNSVVEPGASMNVVFRSTEDNDVEIAKGLIDDFRSGEKDFRLLFLTLDGNQVVSEAANFSNGIKDEKRKLMLSDGESMSI